MIERSTAKTLQSLYWQRLDTIFITLYLYVFVGCTFGGFVSASSRDAR